LVVWGTYGETAGKFFESYDMSTITIGRIFFEIYLIINRIILIDAKIILSKYEKIINTKRFVTIIIVHICITFRL